MKNEEKEWTEHLDNCTKCVRRDPTEEELNRLITKPKGKLQIIDPCPEGKLLADAAARAA